MPCDQTDSVPIRLINEKSCWKPRQDETGWMWMGCSSPYIPVCPWQPRLRLFSRMPAWQAAWGRDWFLPLGQREDATWVLKMPSPLGAEVSRLASRTCPLQHEGFPEPGALQLGRRSTTCVASTWDPGRQEAHCAEMAETMKAGAPYRKVEAISDPLQPLGDAYDICKATLLQGVGPSHQTAL